MYKLQELIDIALFQELQDKLNVIYSFPSAIIDNEGNILTATAWQDICTKFHRVHPISEKECIKSDQYIAEHLPEANPAVSYKCPHGLWDNATPIIIEGIHLGNFFTGQFFLEPPDLEFFKKQAKIYGFDEEAYLEAVRIVPVWTREKLDKYLDFIKGFIEILAGIGLKNLKEIETSKKIKESEEKYRELFEANKDGITIFNFYPDGSLSNFIDMNQSAATMLGYTKLELSGMKPSDLEIDATEEKIRKRASDLKSNEISKFETVIRHKDGSVIPVEITVMLINYDNRPALMNITRDITERKQAEEALISSEEKFAKAFQFSPFALSITGLEDGLLIEVNDSFKNVLGFSREEAIGHSTLDLNIWVTHEDRQRFVSILKKDGFVHNIELDLRTKAGDIATMIVSVELFNMSGRICMLSSFFNITDRKRAEEELIKAKDKAEESDLLKSAFLANMSHEIRTPMNAILGFSQLLEANDLTNEEKNEYTHFIHKRGNDLLNIINDILDISRIEANQLLIYNAQCDINQLLEEVHAIYSTMDEYKERKPVKLIIGKRLPDNTIIYSDSARLKQVLTNLISNSLKFTDKGIIEFGCTVEKDYTLQFYVKDTGIGIPKVKQNVIFERFRQVDEGTHSRKFGGTGLGLSISKGIVELMKGKIWLESTEFVGTTFFFSVPYYPIQIEVPKTEKPITQTYDWSDKLILIVEDDEYNAKLIIKYLDKAKANYLIAETGNKALEIFRTNPNIHLVLMDIQLPDIDGLEVTKTMLKIKPEVLVIAQTAHAFSEDKRRSLEAGCCSYMSKPLDKDKFFSTINTCLRGE